MAEFDDDIWVFGYGSLMWRPGFRHAAAEPALLHGYHRAFCIYSWVHRGTVERPGLVLGLDRGGCCHGLAFRVAAGDAQAALDYLDARELVTPAYLRRVAHITVAGRRARAYTYVVDRGHPQYAGKLCAADCARIIRGARGKSGENPEYLTNTVAHLDTLGLADGRLHAIQRLIEAGTP